MCTLYDCTLGLAPRLSKSSTLRFSCWACLLYFPGNSKEETRAILRASLRGWLKGVYPSGLNIPGSTYRIFVLCICHPAVYGEGAQDPHGLVSGRR
jgi:hypothetical protein